MRPRISMHHSATLRRPSPAPSGQRDPRSRSPSCATHCRPVNAGGRLLIKASSPSCPSAPVMLAPISRVSISVWVKKSLLKLACSIRLEEAKACVGPFANLVARAMADSSAVPSGTVRVASPHSTASAAESSRFSKISSWVRRSPISRGNSQVEPPSGLSPAAV